MSLPPSSSRTYLPLNMEDKITFQDFTQQYGRAEFIICPIFRHGKCKRVYITALQQKREIRDWVLDLPYAVECVWFSSWVHKGLSEPRIWRQYYCKEHKCLTSELYVPTGSGCMTFEVCFGDTFRINFDVPEVQK